MAIRPEKPHVWQYALKSLMFSNTPWVYGHSIKTPCKGKSFLNRLAFEAFALTGRQACDHN